MNPDDTVRASEEVGVERGSHSGERLPVSNAADTQRKSGTRVDASASPSWCAHCPRRRGTQWDGGEHVVPDVSIDYFFMGPCGQEEAQGVLPMLEALSHG